MCLLTGSAMAGNGTTLTCCVLFHDEIKLGWLYLFKFFGM